MTLICLASQKGSPGTSAAALAIAAAFQPGEGRRKVLLEADLSGGALAIRYRLPTEPGLVTLAAAARAGLTDDELWRHVGELPGGLPAVVCPDGPDQVHSALAAAGPILGRHLANRRDVDVICDLGRLQPGSPAVEFAAEANALLIVARPTAEQLQPAARRMLSLRPRIKNLGWLLVGEKPHGPAEVESTFGFPVVGVLADDRRSVEAIEAGEVTRRVRRHPFVRSAATVSSTLSMWLSPLAVPDRATPAPAEPAAPASEPAAQRSPASPLPAGGALPPAAPAPGIPDPQQPAPSSTEVVGPDLADLPAPADDAFPTPGPAPDLAETAPGPSTNGHGPPPIAAVPSPSSPSSSELSSPRPIDPAPLDTPVVDPPAPPAPPLPPPGQAREAGRPPDPFVHDEDDIEWTGT